MDDELKRRLLDDILNHVGPDGIGKITIEENNTILVGQQLPTQMPPHLTREEAMELYRFLTTNCYIEPATSSENFLYLMGVTMSVPAKLKPINWLQTVQQLRVMLTLTFDDPIKRGAIRLADIEKRAPECFLNKGNKMKELAKATKENSIELDKLEKFFRPKQE